MKINNLKIIAIEYLLQTNIVQKYSLLRVNCTDKIYEFFASKPKLIQLNIKRLQILRNSQILFRFRRF